MLYSDDFVEEVRSRNDIVEVVGERVRLERRGANYFGLCPFHSEKSPSFSVHQGKQIFHCFGCGEGGNVYTFLMKYDSLSFKEAVKMLAERAGMAVPDEEDTESARKNRNRRETLLAINKEAALYYYHRLHSDEGERGLRYFKDRELTDAVIRHFGLGFADIGGDRLAKHLREKGYSDAQIIEAGLAVNDEKRGLVDKFWNRVMFPIFDIQNRVIGFGGRVMGEGKPKYLNSPETPVFDKGRNLYGLNYAKNARAGHVILCEGYMDVIAMHQAGFTQALASLGTAFTGTQANILRRYTEEVVLSYDSDEAGIKAARRAIGLLKEAGLRGRVLDLTPHKDPDEFIKAEGREAFAERIKKAEGVFFFELKVSERDFDLNDPDGRTRFIRMAAKRLCEFSDPIERDNYIAATAERYGVGLKDLRDLVSDTAAREGIAVMAPRAPVRTAGERRAEADDRSLKPQRMLMTILADEPELLSAVEKYISPSDFTEGIYRTAAERMFEAIRRGDFSPASLINTFAEKDAGAVAAIFDTPVDGRAEADREERAEALKKLIKEVKRHSLNVEAEKLDKNSPDIFKRMAEYKKRLESLKNEKIDLF